MNLEELIALLQVAIAPVILISGVGMLLLVMTNRLARTIDRSHTLMDVSKEAGSTEQRNLQAQLDILWRRASLLRTAIFLASMSALLAALLVILIFISEVMHWQIVWLISAVFIGSMLGVIGSMIWFLRDVNLSLHALAIESKRSGIL